MASLDLTRAEIEYLVFYLRKAESRDKICRAIQYGSKFISNGEPGRADTVDKNTSLARKVFRLLKFVNQLHALLAPAPKETALPIVLLEKSRNVLYGTFFALDQIVWAGRSGIYENKERTNLFSKISLYCWMAGTCCSGLIEVTELSQTAVSFRKTEKELRRSKKTGNPESVTNLREQKKAHLAKSKRISLSLAKSGLDVLVAIGLLQLAPKTITPRVTGALGFTTSLISCYQLLPPKAKKTV